MINFAHSEMFTAGVSWRSRPSAVGRGSLAHPGSPCWRCDCFVGDRHARRRVELVAYRPLRKHLALAPMCVGLGMDGCDPECRDAVGGRRPLSIPSFARGRHRRSQDDRHLQADYTPRVARWSNGGAELLLAATSSRRENSCGGRKHRDGSLVGIQTEPARSAYLFCRPRPRGPWTDIMPLLRTSRTYRWRLIIGMKAFT